jgi:6-phosphofructokinase 1
VGDEPYRSYYSLAPLAGISNKEKPVPLEWIDTENATVTEEFMRYARPLVRGEASERFVNGLPQFFRFDWSKIIRV